MFALLLILFAAPQAGPPPDYNKAYDILMAAKVQAYYAKIQDFKSAFKHIYTKRFHGPQPVRYGYIWVKKPGKMYWRYDAPKRRIFVCDGSRIWIYTPDKHQALWRDIQHSKLPSAVKFLWGGGDILADFYVKVLTHSKYGGAGKVVLKLKPKRPSTHYTHILFVTTPKGPIAPVVQTIVYDLLGNRNQYTFVHPVLNSRILDKRFAFHPPRGTRVIHATDKATTTP
ncbi:MAG: outer membrane lipoprotein carrier protein LolA [Deltaproteobacteria bacterium]|nr:outer membrane lipoprotein carrier protein LolA [Deltaproteobacteria bacterium]